MNTPDPYTCPHCRTSLRGLPIPEKDRENCGGATHYRTAICIVDRDLDKTVEVRCPDCHQAIWKDDRAK